MPRKQEENNTKPPITKKRINPPNTNPRDPASHREELRRKLARFARMEDGVYDEEEA